MPAPSHREIRDIEGLLDQAAHDIAKVLQRVPRALRQGALEQAFRRLDDKPADDASPARAVDEQTARTHARRTKNCSTCRAPIVFLQTRLNKFLPVDASTVLPDDTRFDARRHVNHFDTCPSADQHRRKSA